MHKAKTVLITGAAGFVGSWLAREAKKQGYLLMGIDVHGPLEPHLWERFATSNLETVDLASLLEHNDVVAVCHLAGSASVPASIGNPYGDFSSLLPGTARLALFVAKYFPKAKFFLFSSAAIYGNPKTLPIKETSASIPVSPYGIHKLLAETLLTHYKRLYGLDIRILRIFSVYGPGLRKQLLWDIYQKCTDAVKSGSGSITLFGTGLESRDFIYIVDLCRSVFSMIKDEDNHDLEVVNIGSGVESTIKTLADNFVSQLGFKVGVEFNGIEATGNPVNWRADVSKLQELGFTPQYGLNEGLEQVAGWAKTLVDKNPYS
jgi:UDP-glucose 4-epimerase